MVFKTQQELDDYVEWTKLELKRMAQHVRDSDLFQEEAVGHAVWTLPHRLFIGKVWPKSASSKAYWIISGVDIPTDHIEASLAETARDAARHFCMKWQLQSGRLSALGPAESNEQTRDESYWEEISVRLRAQAEGLYGLVEQEHLWRRTEGPLLGLEE
ncbi:MAG: hypothetical protein AMJ65_03525 [Phycisphaerae bacterium SG8_4]|jgi:hypothetical protein|nr:MAG: hypothetical protein AMJ65_03525 [Phycisphaerae bacterium SG8_4]